MSDKEQQVIDAVTQYAYDRHSHLTKSNVMGLTEEDLERIAVDKRGFLQFTIENVEIEEQEDKESNSPTWYVSAALCFQVTDGEEIMCDEEVYEAYQDNDGKWIIQWSHC